MKFYSKYKTIPSWKCIWKYLLNGGHLVPHINCLGPCIPSDQTRHTRWLFDLVKYILRQYEISKYDLKGNFDSSMILKCPPECSRQRGIHMTWQFTKLGFISFRDLRVPLQGQISCVIELMDPKKIQREMPWGPYYKWNWSDLQRSNVIRRHAIQT